MESFKHDLSWTGFCDLQKLKLLDEDMSIVYVISLIMTSKDSKLVDINKRTKIDKLKGRAIINFRFCIWPRKYEDQVATSN